MFRACYASRPAYDGLVPNATANSVDWPGKRLGLPSEGPRSVARPGRRIAAIVIDWALASAVGYAFFGGDGFAILASFAALQYLFIVTASGSIGHLILGMRVVPLLPAWIGLWKPLVRTILLCLLIPAVVWNRDQRGLHDLIPGTVLVRR